VPVTGQRNGHCDLTINSTAGPVEFKRPKLRNTAEKFAATLLGKGVVRSAPLEALNVGRTANHCSDQGQDLSAWPRRTSPHPGIDQGLETQPGH